MNWEDGKFFLQNRLDEFNSIILTKLNKTVEKMYRMIETITKRNKCCIISVFKKFSPS